MESLSIAGLDLGTNTFRLLIAQFNGERSFRPILSDQRIVRLGEGLNQHGRLREDAMGRALDCIKSFQHQLRRCPVHSVIAVGTSALREASNGTSFVEAVRKETGISIEIISPEEEARRTLLGVMSGFPEKPARFLVIDIGGGSTEFVWGGKAEEAPRISSSDLGVVKLVDRFYSPDERVGIDQPGLLAFIQSRLDRVKTELSNSLADSGGPVCFVGTAGTVTTLAAMDLGLKVYEPQRVHLHRLDYKTVNRLYEFLCTKTAQDRLSIPGLEKGREDLIIPGSLIVLVTMQSFGFNELVVSDYGLREGILVDHYRKVKT